MYLFTSKGFLDYCPFGAPMVGRSYSSSSYRYGFNGQEKDDEVTGNSGATYTAMFWEYDARLGRRWNTDPVVQEWVSPYATLDNNPINGIDPFGDKVIFDSHKAFWRAMFQAATDKDLRKKLIAQNRDYRDRTTSKTIGKRTYERTTHVKQFYHYSYSNVSPQ